MNPQAAKSSALHRDPSEGAGTTGPAGSMEAAARGATADAPEDAATPQPAEAPEDATTPQPAEATDPTPDDAPHVLVVGGGIAGLTAALYLARCNYRVTLLERKEMLGGNLASRQVAGGACLDVYPHMYQAWYRNFWALMETVHVSREANFRSFSSVCQLQPTLDGEIRLAKLTRPYSAAHLVENLFSGVAPPADMFLFGYASLDLMAEIRNPTLKIENVSLTGYLSTRVYMTRTALEAYEAFVLRVWGIPAYMISAADCQSYAAYCYATADEDGYLSIGPAEDNVIDPIRRQLESYKLKGGKDAVEIIEDHELTKVAIKELEGAGGGRVTEVEWRKTPKRRQLHFPPLPPDEPPPFAAKLHGDADWSPGELSDLGAEEPFEMTDPWSEEPPELGVFFGAGAGASAQPAEERGEEEGVGEEGAEAPVTRKDFAAVVLAVPPSALSTLARREAEPRTRRIVDAIPELAGLDRVGSAPIPVVHLYLETPLDVGKDPVALNGSKLSLAFTDISKNWKALRGQQGTVLALSCSEPLPLVGPKWWDNGFAMIKELSDYLPFKPGKFWNDPTAQVNWEKTTYDANADAQLSLNAVGSDPWRPETCYPEQVENLYFAGDYCQHDYGITTIEGAVATGVKAASAVRAATEERGEAIEEERVELLAPEAFVGMRYAWLATALAAMGWSKLTTPSEVAERANESIAAWTGDPFELLAKTSTLRYLLTPGLPADPPGP